MSDRLPFLTAALASLLALASAPAYAAWPADPAVNLPVCTAPNDQESPALISDGMGGVLIAWADTRNGNSDIFVQHVLPSGVVDPGWPSDGLALCTAAGDQLRPQIVSDGAGGAIVTWSDARSGVRAIYAQRVLPDGTVHPDWPVNGRAMGGNLAAEYDRATVSDGAQGAIVAWESMDARVLAQRILPSGVLDPSWPAAGVPLCGSTSFGWVAMVEDGAGGAIITWMDVRDIWTDIYAHHVLAGGVVDPAWPANGSLVCGADQNQFDPVIVTDGAGGAIVAWRDLRGVTAYQAFAQHVQADGAVDPAWAPGGQLLSFGSDDVGTVSIASDGAGGVIAAWSGDQDGSASLLAIRVLSSGVVDPRWPAGGLPINPVEGLFTAGPTLVEDGNSGAIVGWKKFQNDAFDLHAQHVLESGAVDPNWPSQGAPITTAVNTQAQQVLAADGTGGVIAAWMDTRMNGIARDIYAQRVNEFGSGGGTVGVDPGAPAMLRIERAWPNPVRAALDLRVVLTQDRPVEVEVFDVSGRRVALHSAGALPPGPHVIRVPLSGVIASGTYVVRLSQGADRQVARVAVLR